ncbi:LysR family transcriptional regulator [Brevundimonas sp.]|uniref:LysR family transcriptional regulator n=1 Tax=Brevundimonas sp. TaxID=1871086 RepID=UPI0037C07B5C
MELRHIRYFLAVAEEGNFTRAAARLGIGQPPLSQQIKDLEAEVGTALFHRIPRGAELTAAGEAFLEGVRDMPDQARGAAEAARRTARGEIGSLRIGFTGSGAFNALVPHIIRDYRRAAPGVDLTLEETNSNGLVAALRAGTMDVAFLRPGAVSEEGLRFRTMAREPMVAAVPASHPLAQIGPGGERKPIHLADLAEDAFILTPRVLGPSLFDLTVDACRAAGFEPIQGQSAPQIASVLALVSAEFGVALTPASMRDALSTGVVYLDLLAPAPFAPLALASRRDDRSPAVSAFISLAMKAGAGHGAPGA